MSDEIDVRLQSLDNAIQSAENDIRVWKKLLDEKQEVLEALRDRRVKYSL